MDDKQESMQGGMHEAKQDQGKMFKVCNHSPSRAYDACLISLSLFVLTFPLCLPHKVTSLHTSNAAEDHVRPGTPTKHGDDGYG